MADSEHSAMDSQDDLIPAQAKAVNKELLLSLVTAMVNNPEVDLMTLVPPSYAAQWKGRTHPIPKKNSKLTELNQRTFGALLSAFQEDPSFLLVHPSYSDYYDRQRQRCLATKKQVRRPVQHDERSDAFYAIVDETDAAFGEILFPLSLSISTILQDPQDSKSKTIPAEPLRGLIKESDCLWTGFESFVARLSEEIVVKVGDYDQINHHLALQYLAQHAPDVPTPKSHGLIRLGTISMLFMSYIPGQTLESVWSTLTHEDKSSIQQQLEVAFTRIRGIDREDRPLGTIDGESVQDGRGLSNAYLSKDPIFTVEAFDNWVFSSRPFSSKTYFHFLKTLMPESQQAQDGVFTHCDVRPANIMVDADMSGSWRVSGIFDWENAGFYPTYWEAVKTTTFFYPKEENDWYLYLPKCIAPSSFARQWLVDRAREAAVENLKAWTARPSKVQKRN